MGPGWAALIIVALACLAVGVVATVLWFRARSSGVVKGEIRARVERSRQDELQKEQGRSDEDALEQLRKKIRGGGERQP
jgi:flagellar biosynthesis/type III secretory pathway M-ring protein FliF/YscJ